MKNQKGMSLVEIMIALGITAAAAAAYMTHAKNVSKNEGRQRVRASVSQLEMQATDYLKSRDVCYMNAARAFEGVPITDPNVSGNPLYKKLTNRGFKGEDGNLVFADIFYGGQLFDGGKIHVKDVIYELKDITPVTAPNSPWNRAARMIIGVEFEICSDGSRVFFNEADTTAALCSIRSTMLKKFEKHAAFRVEDDLIAMRPVMEQVPDGSGGMVWQASGEEELDLDCADSQDALIEASREYADLKNCITLAKTFMMTGTSGVTPCGITVTASTESKEFPLGTTNDWRPQNLVKNTAEVMLISGGGGGHGRDTRGFNDGGKGGDAGRYHREKIPGMVYTCKIEVGEGGEGGDQNRQGRRGGTSLFECRSNGVVVAQESKMGGLGGREATGNNCGTDGGDLKTGLDGNVIARGGTRGCSGSAPGAGEPGAGGGGAGDNSNARQGGKGGNGRVYITWKSGTATDPNNVLQRVGSCVEELRGGICP